MNQRVLVFPLLLLAMVAVFAYRGLSIDTASMPSVLIGKPAPRIELEPVPGYPGPFDRTAFTGEVTLVNIWGSWCIACLYEHPTLLRMQAEGVAIYGIAWNDVPEDAAAWLERHGSPFVEVGLDQAGYDVAEFGITGAPETFVIDKDGIVRHRHAGPISEREWEKVFKPLIARLEAEGEGPSPGASGRAVLTTVTSSGR